MRNISGKSRVQALEELKQELLIATRILRNPDEDDLNAMIHSVNSTIKYLNCFEESMTEGLTDPLAKLSIGLCDLQAGQERRKEGQDLTPEAFLTDVKMRLPEIVSGAVIKGEEIRANGKVDLVFRHAPCQKFRIAFPMSVPWKRSDYPDLNTAEEAFKDACKAVIARLGLVADASCVELARLFYLPRVPNKKRMKLAQSIILEGECCPALAHFIHDHRQIWSEHTVSAGSTAFFRD